MDDGIQHNILLRSSSKSNSITVEQIRIHVVFPEYPATSKSGIAHLVPIEPSDSQKSIKDKFKQVSTSKAFL